MKNQRDKTRRWQQWTEREARAALEELASTSESTVQFARRKGVSVHRLSYWRKRLTGAMPAFVSVSMPAPTLASVAQLEVVARGITVRVREDIGLDRFGAIVAVLADDRGRTC